MRSSTKTGYIALLFFLLCFKSKSQSPDTTTVKKLLHYILQPIDKTQVSTSFLEEWGAPIIPMATFNGTLTDSNRFDMNLWRTLYFQLQTAYCGSASNPLPSITTANAAIKQNVSDSLPIPIPLLIGQYNSVKEYAFTNGLLSHNTSTNQIYDVLGRSENPYYVNNLFAACPNSNVSRDGSESFIIKPALIWNNTNKAISQVQIDFAKGQGFQNVTIGTAFSVSYSDTGNKRWKIKITLNDNTVLQCYTNYHVLKAENIGARYDPLAWDNFQIFPANANHSGGTIFIRYSDRVPTNTIRKPLIVVEGYVVSLVARNLQDNYTYLDFVRAINNEPVGYDFNGQLDDVAGYDLIFVDFNNGTDDITRNAELIEEVIAWVNANKVPNSNNSNIIEQNVVMGLSMGGLVSRYALAEMTKANVNTQTRLLITHDSPHRGANVPLGLQYLIHMAGNVELFGLDVRDVYPQYDEAINLLGEAATQQMLLYRANSSNSFVNNSFLDGEYRNMITFGATGPQPTYRFIATSLGVRMRTSVVSTILPTSEC